ncbi:MAG: glycosyltransferase family protein [Anaerolineae bacterium]|nr:glycosyltransferase family protein [Anaerolineae bacterium]
MKTAAKTVVKTVVIIQARMGSTRLPGKALRDIAGQPMLAWVVARARRAALVDEVVVATTLSPADAAIVAECERLQVACFRGSEEDVLDRYYRAAQAYQADVVVRITSDCPLIEPAIIDQVIGIFQESGADYASNTLARTFPRGLDTEVFSMVALGQTWEAATAPFQRAHVTPYMYQNPYLFRLVGVTAGEDYGRYRWTVDTVEDWQLVQAIYEHFAPRQDFGWQEVLQLLAEAPQLAAINAHIAQKELQQG